jgi:hypothetical protein
MISDSPPSPTETALSAGASGEHRGVRFGLSRSSLHSHEWLSRIMAGGTGREVRLR